MRLIKMWAPEHFRGGRLSYVPRGTAMEQANGMMGPRQLPQFASRLMDVFIPRQSARSHGRMEIFQLRPSLIRDGSFKIQRDL